MWEVGLKGPSGESALTEMVQSWNPHDYDDCLEWDKGMSQTCSEQNKSYFNCVLYCSPAKAVLTLC